jgi:hypothetical protein
MRDYDRYAHDYSSDRRPSGHLSVMGLFGHTPDQSGMNLGSLVSASAMNRCIRGSASA